MSQTGWGWGPPVLGPCRVAAGSPASARWVRVVRARCQATWLLGDSGSVRSDATHLAPTAQARTAPGCDWLAVKRGQ